MALCFRSGDQQCYTHSVQTLQQDDPLHASRGTRTPDCHLLSGNQGCQSYLKLHEMDNKCWSV